MNKISILIVEDELELLKAYSKYISIFCDTVYTASNADEGWSLYNEHKPNIILTDINMPKTNGIEFIEKIRQEDNKTKIIVLSAHTKTEHLLKAVKLDLISYLVKPVKMDELKQTIQEAINEVSNNNQIYLNNGYFWDAQTNSLKYKNNIIDLPKYEHSFIQCLINKLNQDVSYEELHSFIYNLDEYSLSAITSLVKRIRQKTTKDLIRSSFKFGYKIEADKNK